MAHVDGGLDQPIGSGLFREALAAFPTGVTVITVRDEHGRPCGMTANAFCAVSLEPPLVLVCVNRSASTHDRIVREGSFGVNILSETSEEISRHCARPGSDKHLRDEWLVERNVRTPHLKDAAAYLHCCVESAHPAGTHSIIVGAVIEVVSRLHEPLLYYRGGYRRMSPRGMSPNVL